MILLAACKKTGTAKEMADPSLPGSQAAVNWQKIPANPLNKYDTMGQRHNDILVYMRTQLKGLRHPDLETITRYAMEYSDKVMAVQLPGSFFSTVPETVADEPNGYATLINSISYSSDVKTSLLELIKIVRTVCADKNVVYDDIKNAIVQFENRINDNQTLSPDGKQKILETASVARYSAFYWLELDPRGKDLKDARLLWWIASITSDIAGAVVSGSSVYAAECSEYAFDLLTYSLP